MEIGHFQVLVSVILVIAAIAVAIIVDVLKKNNDQLRELTIELKVRRDVEGKQSRFVAVHTAPERPSEPAIREAAPQPAPEVGSELKQPEPKQPEHKNEDKKSPAALAASLDEELGQKRGVSPAAIEVIKRAAERAQMKGKKDKPLDAGAPPEGPVTKEMIEKVRKQRAALAASEFGFDEEESDAAPVQESPSPLAWEQPEPMPVGYEDYQEEEEENAPEEAAPEPVTVTPVSAPAVVPTAAQRDWASLLHATRRPEAATQPAAPPSVEVPAPVAETGESVEDQSLEDENLDDIVIDDAPAFTKELVFAQEPSVMEAPAAMEIPEEPFLEAAPVVEPAAAEIAIPEPVAGEPEVEAKQEQVAAKPADPSRPVVVIESSFAFLNDAPAAKAAPEQPAIAAASPAVSAAQEAPAQETPAKEPVATEPALPAGFQDGYVLSRLVQSRQPVSGLVVSIGASVPANAEVTVKDSLKSLIQSLIGPNDFAAQSGEDEFLLIYPGERGSRAQQRLTSIAERLWDFQLHSMGVFTIQFSWGGVEVRSESIEEAIASATERMQETRRGRQRVKTELPSLRRAV